MTAEQLTAELRDCARRLKRHDCGSAVAMGYDPGVTWIYCFRCDRSVMALPDWSPVELTEKWNDALSGGDWERQPEKMNSLPTNSAELGAVPRREQRPCSPLRVLRLTLKRKWFNMIASGEKREEYREPGNWIMSRLTGKDYDVVEFANGYGAHVPRVTCRFLGWTWGGGRTEWGASPDRHYVVIRLGEILSSENSALNEPKENNP